VPKSTNVSVSDFLIGSRISYPIVELEFRAVEHDQGQLNVLP